MGFWSRVATSFLDTLDSQTQKGMKKYGKMVDPMDPNYDWIQMMREELVDAFQYLEAEEARREELFNLYISMLSNIKKQYPITSELVDQYLEDLYSFRWGKEGRSDQKDQT